jgi:hypothetical protein
VKGDQRIVASLRWNNASVTLLLHCYKPLYLFNGGGGPAESAAQLGPSAGAMSPEWHALLAGSVQS